MQIQLHVNGSQRQQGMRLAPLSLGFTLKDTTYIKAKLEQIKGARQSVTAVGKERQQTPEDK